MAENTVGKATLRAVLDDAQYRSALDNLVNRTERAGGRAARSLDQIGTRMTSVGRGMSMALTLPILGAGAAVLKVSGDFESSMNRVSAISGATGDDLERLRDQAKDLGESTQFSASQAADGMGYLAQAGFEVNDVYAAMPGTLQLAAAGQLDLASAADLASNVLTGFALEADEIGRVNDVLAKTSTTANTNIAQLGEAMSYAAPVAAGFGVDVESASAAVGLLSNAGIQGSRAGTGFARILSILSQEAETLGVQVFDASGEMRPFADILEDIEATGLTSSEAMAVFGQRGGPAMQALLSQGSGALRELQTQLENSGGTAERIANKQMEGFNGKLKELRSAAEGLAIELGDAGLLEAATDLAEGLTGLTRRFGELDDGTQRFIVTAGITAAALGPILIGVGNLIRAVGALRGAWVALRTAALAPLLGVGGALALTVAGINGIAYAITGEFPIARRVAGMTEAFEEFFEGLRTGEGRMQRAILLLNQLNPFSVTQGRSERDFFKDVWGYSEEELREIGLGIGEPGASIGLDRGFGYGEGLAGGGGGGGRSSDELPPGVPDPDEVRESLNTLSALETQLGELQEAFANAGNDAERLAIAEQINATNAEIERMTSVLDTAGSGVAEVVRGVRDVFSDLEAGGIAAERRAEALGNDVEDRLTSVQTRASQVSAAMDELFLMGLTAADERVQYLVERLEELRAEAEALANPEAPATGDAGLRMLEDSGGGNVGRAELLADRREEAQASQEAARSLNQAATASLALRDGLDTLEWRFSGANARAFTEHAGGEIPRRVSPHNLSLRELEDAGGGNVGRAELERDREEEATAARELARDLNAAATASRGLRDGLSVDEWRFTGVNAQIYTEHAGGDIPEVSRDEQNLRMLEDAGGGNVGRAEVLAGREEEETAARELARELRIAAAGSRELRDGLSATEWRYSGENARMFTEHAGGTATEPFVDSLSRSEQEARDQSEDIYNLGQDPVAVAELQERLEQAGIDFADSQRQSAIDFAGTVIDAGSGFVDAISAFREGDISGGIGALGGVAGGIASLIPGGAAFAPLIQSGFGLLGGLMGLFGGNDRNEQEQREAAARRSRSVPALNINFTVNQQNSYEGGPQMPQVEQAYRRQAAIVVEEFMTRTRLVQRIQALEGSTA